MTAANPRCRMKKRRPKAEDPLQRACSACGARVGQGCRTLGNDSKPLVSRATRLVHAARLEEEHARG